MSGGMGLVSLNATNHLDFRLTGMGSLSTYHMYGQSNLGVVGPC